MKDTILQEYEVRKTNAEKTKFIEYIKSRLSKAGYDEKIDITIEEKGKGILKSRNIIVGNPENAEIICTAHYDTCAVLPIPNLMAPTNVFLFLLSQIAITVVLFGMVFVVAFLIEIVFNGMIDAFVLVYTLLVLLMFHVLFGYRNKHTANDNTSGVITITRILEDMPQELRDKVCVVYFDNEEKGLFGSEFFHKKHKKEVKNKLLLNFDCVGDGRNVCVLGKIKARKDKNYKLFIDTLKDCSKDYDVEFMSRNMKPMMFGSDQMHFDKGVGICALRKSPIGMYVARIHTPFDTKCREENIEFLASGMRRFVENMDDSSL